jgi:HEAT repeat protein
VRAAAARALGRCGDTEHHDALADLLDDPEEEVRRAAGRARERMAERLDV